MNNPRRVEPMGLKRYDLFAPYLECASKNLSRFGQSDGGKFLCMDAVLQQPGCIIYSLGSNGNYDFEEAMLQASIFLNCLLCCNVRCHCH